MWCGARGTSPVHRREGATVQRRTRNRPSYWEACTEKTNPHTFGTQAGQIL